MNRKDGARVMVSSWRRPDDNAIPSRNKIIGAYVNSALAQSEALLNGFDEALMLCADGHLAEGSAENVFIVRAGTLITPPVTDEILEGITRATVLQFAKDLIIRSTVRPVDRSELYAADEGFLCGTAAGILPVTDVDYRPVGSGSPGPLTRKLMKLYDDGVHGKHSRYRQWSTRVYPVHMPAGNPV